MGFKSMNSLRLKCQKPLSPNKLAQRTHTEKAGVKRWKDENGFIYLNFNYGSQKCLEEA
jgi:ABC-type lipoprotein release transport system permease subunit